MPTPTWAPGFLYQPGAVVQPLSSTAGAPVVIENGDLEAGATGWTFSNPSIQIVNAPGSAFQGSWIISWLQGLYGDHQFVNDGVVPVVAGQSITINCKHLRGTNNSGRQGASLGIEWLDSDYVSVGKSMAPGVISGASGVWFTLSHTAVAQTDAVFARARVEGYNNNDGGNHGMLFDIFTWDYLSPQSPAGLVFKAVQASAGYSGSDEPTWPLINGQQVVDNEVTWEATFASRVLWEASPILVSGAVEPNFPASPDATVADNTIAWVALDARIKDERCPSSKVVIIAASKVFAADDDIVAFSATVNPLDWSTEQDAGFLPFGLQSYGSTPVSALGLYRGNLVAFNDQGYQMWQVDEDPANMAILDASPIDCPYPKTVQPVSNDLVVLTSVGVRNIGIAGASTNLQAGFFGKQIDPLVLAKIQALAVDDEPFALFWPGAGQYWLFFGAEAFVLTMNGGVKDMSWSRYVFPAEITDWAILETELYIRTADGFVWTVDEEALADDTQIVAPAIPGFDIPSETGTYLAWPNAVLFSRSQSEGVGEIPPNGYSSEGEGRVDIAGGGLALVANSGNTGPTAEFVVRVTGEDIDGNVITEDITKATGDLFAFSLTTFYAITGVELLTSDTGSDGAYCVGYQTFTADADSDTLIVDIRGALTITKSALNAGQSVELIGLLSVSGVPVDVPDGAQLTFQRQANASAKIFTVNGNEAVSMPAGSVGQLVTSVAEYNSVTALTAASGTSIFVDIGVYLIVEQDSTPFDGLIWWPYLDFGQLGTEKQLEGFDLVFTGSCDVTFGYSQSNAALATPAYTIDGDTLPGNMVPMPISGPSFQLRLDFPGADQVAPWEWSAASLYLTDRDRQ